jgi:DNA-binding GntR family transcriptional regulator
MAGGQRGDAGSGFRRVDAPSLVERVANDLREAIVAGRLRPGDKVSDARIASEMGLSRAPVREAIRRLAAQGLVREEPRRGAFVASLSRSGVMDIYDCRRALESMAARRVATERPAEARRLAEIMRGMRPIARRGDRVEMAEADIAYHQTLCALAGNAWLDRLYGVIADQMRLLLTVNNVAHPPVDVNELADIHRPITDAIADGDPEAAVAAVIEHLDVAEQLFLAEVSPELLVDDDLPVDRLQSAAR